MMGCAVQMLLVEEHLSEAHIRTDHELDSLSSLVCCCMQLFPGLADLVVQAISRLIFMLALLLSWHQRGKEGWTDGSLGLGEGELVGCHRNSPQLAKGQLHLLLIPCVSS